MFCSGKCPSTSNPPIPRLLNFLSPSATPHDWGVFYGINPVFSDGHRSSTIRVWQGPSVIDISTSAASLARFCKLNLDTITPSQIFGD